MAQSRRHGLALANDPLTDFGRQRRIDEHSLAGFENRGLFEPESG